MEEQCVQTEVRAHVADVRLGPVPAHHLPYNLLLPHPTPAHAIRNEVGDVEYLDRTVHGVVDLFRARGAIILIPFHPMSAGRMAHAHHHDRNARAEDNNQQNTWQVIDGRHRCFAL